MKEIVYVYVYIYAAEHNKKGNFIWTYRLYNYVNPIATVSVPAHWSAKKIDKYIRLLYD